LSTRHWLRHIRLAGRQGSKRSDYGPLAEKDWSAKLARIEGSYLLTRVWLVASTTLQAIGALGIDRPQADRVDEGLQVMAGETGSRPRPGS
jgi:hypothetical protein